MLRRLAKRRPLNLAFGGPQAKRSKTLLGFRGLSQIWLRCGELSSRLSTACYSGACAPKILAVVELVVVLPFSCCGIVCQAL